MDIKHTCCICHSNTKKLFNIGKLNKDNEKIREAIREVLDIHNLPRTTCICFECSKTLISQSNFKLVSRNNLGVYVTKLLGRTVEKDTILSLKPETVSAEETKTVSYNDMYSKSDYDYISISSHSESDSDSKENCEDFCNQDILSKNSVRTNTRKRTPTKNCCENAESLQKNKEGRGNSSDIFTDLRKCSINEETPNISGTSLDKNVPKTTLEFNSYNPSKQETCLRMNSSNEIMFSSSGDYNESDSDEVQIIGESGSNENNNSFFTQPKSLTFDFTNLNGTELLDSLTSWIIRRNTSCNTNTLSSFDFQGSQKILNAKKENENIATGKQPSFKMDHLVKDDFRKFSDFNYENVTPDYFLKYIPLTIKKFTPYKVEQNKNSNNYVSNLFNTEKQSENYKNQTASKLKEKIRSLFPTLKFNFDDEKNNNECLESKNKNLSKTKESVYQNTKGKETKKPLKRHACLYSRKNDHLSQNLNNNKENVNTSNTVALLLNSADKNSKYKCKICQIVFATKSECSMHTRSHIPDHFCCLCQKKFSNKYLLTQHEREFNHNLLKTFKCCLCNRVYKNSDSIIAHYVSLNCVTETFFSQEI